MEGVPLRSWFGAYNCHPGFTLALKINMEFAVSDFAVWAFQVTAVLS